MAILPHEESAVASSSSLVCRFFRFQGKTYSLWIDPHSTSLTELQAKLFQKLVVEEPQNYSYYDQYNYSPDDLIVTGGGKILQSHKDVGAVLERNQNWEVFCPQKGGCFIISFSIVCIIALACVASFCTCGCSLVVIPFLLPFLFVLPLCCL